MSCWGTISKRHTAVKGTGLNLLGCTRLPCAQRHSHFYGVSQFIWSHIKAKKNMSTRNDISEKGNECQFFFVIRHIWEAFMKWCQIFPKAPICTYIGLIVLFCILNCLDGVVKQFYIKKNVWWPTITVGGWNISITKALWGNERITCTDHHSFWLICALRTDRAPWDLLYLEVVTPHREISWAVGCLHSGSMNSEKPEWTGGWVVIGVIYSTGTCPWT